MINLAGNQIVAFKTVKEREIAAEQNDENPFHSVETTLNKFVAFYSHYFNFNLAFIFSPPLWFEPLISLSHFRFIMNFNISHSLRARALIFGARYERAFVFFGEIDLSHIDIGPLEPLTLSVAMLIDANERIKGVNCGVSK